MAKVAITVTIPDRLKERLTAAAQETGLSVSGVVEEALEVHLDTVVVLERALGALKRSEAHRSVLQRQVRVISDFVADAVGDTTKGS